MFAAAGSVVSVSDVLAAGAIAIPPINATGSAVWPTANLALFMPFSIPAQQTVNRMIWFNGTVVSGNVDAGVYNEDGTRVVTCGSTAQAGISVAQVANVTATPLAAGSYFMALACDNITATFSRWPFAATYLRGGPIVQAAGSFVLPASVTFAAPANAYLPLLSVGFVTTT